jgi:MtN3 and saliva related transmembrane protein
MELDEITMGVIGIAAGILILSGWVPQIARGYKTKRLNDVSSYLMILIFAGAALWLVYGIALDDVYIMGVNLAAMILTMIVLSMKLKYEKAARTTSE